MNKLIAMAVIFISSSQSFAENQNECRPVTIYTCQSYASGTARKIVALTYFGCEGSIVRETEIASNVSPQDCIRVLSAKSASE